MTLYINGDLKKIDLNNILYLIPIYIYLRHNFDFSNPKILDKVRNLEKRLILEMAEIKKKNLIKGHRCMECFSKIYQTLLKCNKN